MTGSISRIVQARIALALMLVLLSTPLVEAAENGVDWTLESTDGQKVNFQEQIAQGPVVVSFWATWCKPCLKELPHLNRLAGQYKDQVSILAVSVDAPKSVAKVAPFVQSKGYNDMTVLLDTGAELQNLMQVSGIVPFLAIFDAQGREVYRHIGYKDGDEIELEHQIEAALAASKVGTPVDTGKPAWSEAVTATDRFEYSYSRETKKEIFENWLDIGYQFGGFRTGVMLNNQAPSEEGERSSEIAHRFFEFQSDGVGIRAGHFYGLFGRGLVFNSYEDRTVRVDTRLDGLFANYKSDRVTAKVFSGSPLAKDIDIRALDLEFNPLGAVHVGATGLTYKPDNGFVGRDGTVHRETVTALRLRETFSFGDFYYENGWRDRTGGHVGGMSPFLSIEGKALYANVNLYKGPFSVSWEYSDYDNFEVVSGADGQTSLNRPPSLAREFTWTLLNRAPHTLNAKDEKGENLDLMYTDEHGWTILASGADIERHDGGTVYQLGYFSVEKERFGDFRFLGAFGYQESEGLRQTYGGELTWFATETNSLTLQAEQQHVRLGGPPGTDLGAYDQQWFKLEYETAPTWAFAAILELNNKYDEQPPFGEPGPFPSGQVTYTIKRGGNLNIWFGKRQEGFLCSGGVCKFEPEFEGIEFFGVFRY